jgi:hypothetical protein
MKIIAAREKTVMKMMAQIIRARVDIVKLVRKKKKRRKKKKK